MRRLSPRWATEHRWSFDHERTGRLDGGLFFCRYARTYVRAKVCDFARFVWTSMRLFFDVLSLISRIVFHDTL